MKKRYSITKQEVVEAARSFIGARYRHQGRDAETGIDCVGLLVLLGEEINHPNIQDLPDYKRVPSASVLLDYLKRNLREIPLEKVGAGDIVLMKMGGLKPRHTAIITNTATDIINGIEPMLVHALSNGFTNAVVEQPLRIYRQGFTNGFRIRGLK